MNTRPLVVAAIAYVLLVAVGNGLILGGVALARTVGKDPRVDVQALPELRHLRQIDERVWASAPPSGDDYPALQEMGIDVVIDLQTGRPGDARVDRTELATRLGMHYVWVPVIDGRAPEAEDVDVVLRAIDQAEGDVLIVCGAGVGRTTSMTAAYEAGAGRDPSLLRRLAVGPMSFEQAWFILALEPGNPHDDNVVVDALNRWVIDRPRLVVNRIETMLD
jgi:protein tyrosine phosphatase (PTP) superfamily phosphohydrolase (DUF442 family)